MNEEQSEIIVLIFRLKVANYGNFIRGLVTKYGVAPHSWPSRVVTSCYEQTGRQSAVNFLLLTIRKDFD